MMWPGLMHITRQSVLQRSLFSLFVVFILTLNGAEGRCSLPNGLRGWWKDSNKGLLTFSDDTVDGYTIHTFGEFTLSCYLQNSSTYIMESTPFKWFGLNFTAYLCWSFAQQSKRVFHLYEHAEPNQQAGDEKVVMYIPATAKVFDNICSNVTTTNSTTYRLLQKTKGKDKGYGTKIIIIIIVISIAVIGLAVVVTCFVIRRKRSRGIFQINDKPSGSKPSDKAKAYQVSDSDTTATSTPTARPSFKKTTTPRTISKQSNDLHHSVFPKHTQAENHATEDNTSEHASSYSFVSVTGTSGFTSVSPSSSTTAFAPISASASSTGLPNQEANSPMTPICGSDDKEDKQVASPDQFSSVQFSTGQESASDADLFNDD